MTVAFVLSGGGSRGAFQVGALEYLYEIGVSAQIICSTSVGSINGVKLAEGGTLEDQRAAFQELKSIWLGLQGPEQMYTLSPWLAQLSPQTRQLLEDLITEGFSLPSTSDVVFEVFRFPHDPLLKLLPLVPIAVDLRELYTSLTQNGALSLYVLDPIEAQLRQRVDANRVQNSGVKLRLCVVSLESGALRFVTETGEVLERDNQTRVLLGFNNVQSCPDQQRELDALLGEREQIARERDNLDPEVGPMSKPMAAAQIKHLTQEIGRARTALEECQRERGVSTTTLIRRVDLMDGVLASAAMPAIFQAVRLGDETYTDGGVRAILPIQAVLSFTGDDTPDHIIAISASSRGATPAPSFAWANLLRVLERSLVDLALDELTEEGIMLGQRSGIDMTLIVPNIDMHDSIEIDPGLISIMIDYGYMRAADVVGMPQWLAPAAPAGGLSLAGATVNLPVMPPGAMNLPVMPPGAGLVIGPPVEIDPAIRRRREATADAITQLRWQSWQLEHAANGVSLVGARPRGVRLDLVPTLEAFRTVRAFKALINALVQARQSVGGALPANTETWWSNFERHPWQPIFGTPWDYFTSNAGDLPAATLPLEIYIKEAARPDVYLVDGVTKVLITNEDLRNNLTAQDAVYEVPRVVLDSFATV
jgi:predicted acylesterase/phospholipase RssA